MCGICNGFQALIKLGLVPYGKIIDTDETCPTLTYNTISRHQSKIVRTKLVSNNSPWLMEAKVGEIYTANVVRIEAFGAFVNLFKSCDALLHVSKISHDRVNHPKDVLKIGDTVKVIVTEIDEKGRVNVSAKDLLPKPEKKETKKEETK